MDREQNQPFPEYVLGKVMSAGHVLYQGLVISLPIFQVLCLAELQILHDQPLQHQGYKKIKLPLFLLKRITTYKLGLKRQQNKIHQLQILLIHWVRDEGNFLEGINLNWYNSWLNSPGDLSWEEFVNGLNICLGKTYSDLAIAQMWDNLKQDGSIEDFVKKHDKIYQLAHKKVNSN